jgi:hypothetical protein
MNIADFGHGTIRVDFPLTGGKTATLYLNETELLDLLQWQLARLGLDIMPHSHGPEYGWFYAWRDASIEWEGPCDTRKAALEEAFARAVRAIIAQRNAPFPVAVGDAFRWTGEDWETVTPG